MDFLLSRNFFISRYGGDEFAVVTVSIGYAKYAKDIKTQQELISLADKELYKAKKQDHHDSVGK